MGTDRAHFTGIYEANADRVLAYCLRHLPASAAEDAMADTFLVAWRRLEELPDAPLPWLITTARNIIRNRFRAEARGFTLAAKIGRLEKLADESAEVVAERRADLFSALSALTDDERELVLLTAWDGLSGQDAAAAVGLTHSAYRSRLHRARAKMAAAITLHNPWSTNV
ncbi:sigma-70 family RNA polymerase sigma factor [Tessaracoccus sp. OS52]|uniref:RNA polymerase sigma factor n=1 Tax=Tessaracoccus sp. OS52 TaxID=2886691 RepID=UPI001D0F65E8|nr:sigma-70 family RNA polymerase sigma factor [Tessaracoccus sp. OS52]MCC2593143.1 sigma-70 family RNA polymerase sigma factor [Tessaracoccus sp. OS52]